MCPPGPFSISFSLPGQVDPRMFSSTYRPNGILEVIVRKRKFPYNTPEMAAEENTNAGSCEPATERFDFYGTVFTGTLIVFCLVIDPSANLGDYCFCR
ncbi:hypothetical protein LWI29_026038 [Acer saccharum]|uniref:SHSP domain-containing protein n=1 Tax=Acer saccharum TaxID=4024 RepID=A0AA39RMJ6_ACESA|nr:hypothetical protein LWI29_026038 [Acer saccharum]